MARILIVDDVEDITIVLKAILDFDGHSVCTALSGEEALERIRSGEVFDLICLDIEMDPVSGLEVASAINKMPLENKICFCFISSHNDERHVLESMAVGGAEFISKPFDPRETRQIISGLLKESNVSN